MTAEIVNFLKYREQKERAEKQGRKSKPKFKRDSDGKGAQESPSGEALDKDGGSHDGETA